MPQTCASMQLLLAGHVKFLGASLGIILESCS
jgi:hypothetical protein